MLLYGYGGGIMFLGQRIVNLREEHDLTQKELAEKLDFNRSVLNRIEQGTRPCRDDELIKIADFFDVSADFLLGRVSAVKEIPQPAFSSDEKELVAWYRELSEDSKALLYLLRSGKFTLGKKPERRIVTA
jgi:transcriptional regulator with XRE-family HTH domain